MDGAARATARVELKFEGEVSEEEEEEEETNRYNARAERNQIGRAHV